jgi:hypothetical protein
VYRPNAFKTSSVVISVGREKQTGRTLLQQKNTNHLPDFPFLDLVSEIKASFAKRSEREFDVIVVANIHFNFILCECACGRM